jgi:hypothetical protein
MRIIAGWQRLGGAFLFGCQMRVGPCVASAGPAAILGAWSLLPCLAVASKVLVPG